jgi:hypothetical protein
VNGEATVTFVVAGCVLLLALVVGILFEDDHEAGKDDPTGPYL